MQKIVNEDVVDRLYRPEKTNLGLYLTMNLKEIVIEKVMKGVKEINGKHLQETYKNTKRNESAKELI